MRDFIWIPTCYSRFLFLMCQSLLFVGFRILKYMSSRMLVQMNNKRLSCHLRCWFRRTIRIRLDISGSWLRRTIRNRLVISDVGSEEQLEFVMSSRMLVQMNNKRLSCHLGYWFRRTSRIRIVILDVGSEE